MLYCFSQSSYFMVTFIKHLKFIKIYFYLNYSYYVYFQINLLVDNDNQNSHLLLFFLLILANYQNLHFCPLYFDFLFIHN